ncbi:DUF1392 family protein [Nostoc sp. FACHB-110]|uniref:DUF1392 family protein n=1 Tax=Nostoc sp. FACHB-110 TaxID=2692834 RepID=UPI001681EEC6|nr:DUF1392 family protein [Nostoc sp. FACHB-110]MBD2439586.1 DUF1392 family protein [Nostoc sp. FACHB-110]
MINHITALESCWYNSPPWGEVMPALAAQIQEKVFLANSDLSGYCYGVHWENQEWIYAIVCLGETLYLPQSEFYPTKIFNNIVVAPPAFELGDVVEVDFSEQPMQRIIQGIFHLKNSWLYAVEWHSPILEEKPSQQSRIIWLADVDLVRAMNEKGTRS